MRLALGVEYDGSGFHGWQHSGERASPERSVQGVLQRALSSVANAPIKVVCAGRTDAGVHARCQVVHFDTAAHREWRGWVLGATGNLPPSVAVRWCVPVSDEFNARFSARARRYRYRMMNRMVRPALGSPYLAWERRSLDAGAMDRAARGLLGEHDFGAFRSVHCQARHAVREIQRIAVRRHGDLIEFSVQANAFLHHMVRNIVGSLLEIGAGERPEEWLTEVLKARDRTRAGPTAPARGLIFVGPLYARHWALPDEVSLDASASVSRTWKRDAAWAVTDVDADIHLSGRDDDGADTN